MFRFGCVFHDSQGRIFVPILPPSVKTYEKLPGSPPFDQLTDDQCVAIQTAEATGVGPTPTVAEQQHVEKIARKIDTHCDKYYDGFKSEFWSKQGHNIISLSPVTSFQKSNLWINWKNDSSGLSHQPHWDAA